MPVGGAALINGIATWLKHVRPEVAVVGVCAEGAPAPARSFEAGRLIETETSNTIADGISVRQPVAASLETMRRAVDRVVLVPDEEILAAMRLLLRDDRPRRRRHDRSGAGGRFRAPASLPADPSAIPNCGGNLTSEQRKAWLGIG